MTKSADEVSNLNFTREEMEAVSDKTFFRIKDTATKKIFGLFSAIEIGIKEKLKSQSFVAEGLNVQTGKIFRGENYRLYPYVVLDYPRLFSTQSVFAFRTMFWWGHEYSFTLHLQGQALEHYRKQVKENFKLLLNKEVFICVNENPWQYYFEKNNYVPVEEIENSDELTGDKTFIKLSRKINLGDSERTIHYCYETFDLFTSILQS